MVFGQHHLNTLLRCDAHIKLSKPINTYYFRLIIKQRNLRKNSPYSGLVKKSRTISSVRQYSTESYSLLMRQVMKQKRVLMCFSSFGWTSSQFSQTRSLFYCPDIGLCHWCCRLVPIQDVHFFYTRSHFSALQNCALLFSIYSQVIFIFKKCITQFSH